MRATGLPETKCLFLKVINLADKKAKVDKKDDIAEKVVCNDCGKILSSQEKLFLHQRNFHPDRASTIITDKPTQALKDLSEIDKDRLKLKSQEVAELHLDRDLQKLQKETEDKNKGRIDTNELIELKKLELLTQKSQADGGNYLPLLFQQQQQSFQVMLESSNRQFQLMTDNANKQHQLNLELVKLQSQLQNNGFSNISNLVQTIDGIKSLATQLGWAENKTDTFVQGVIKDTLDKLSPSILQPLGQALAEKVRSHKHSFIPAPVNSNTTEENANPDVSNTEDVQTEINPSTENPIENLPKARLEYEDLLRGNPDLFPILKKSEPTKTVDEQLKEKFGV